jgi:hypothetical protein
MSWKTEVAKYIAFTNPPTLLDASILWNKAFGIPPQTYGQPMPGVTQAMGLVDGWRGALTTQAGRIEFALMAQEPTISAQPPPPPSGLPDLPKALADGARNFGRVIDGLTIVRIGLAAEFFQLVESSDAAVAETCKDIGLPAPARGATDFLYQVNVKLPIDGTNLIMNRLCKWASGAVQYLTLVMPPIGTMHSSQSQEIFSFDVRTLSLDLNTAAETPIADGGLVAGLWTTLAQEVYAILSDGHARLR